MCIRWGFLEEKLGESTGQRREGGGHAATLTLVHAHTPAALYSPGRLGKPPDNKVLLIFQE